MEEERVRKLKTEVEIRKKDHKKAGDELRRFIENLEKEDLDRMDGSEYEASRNEIFDLTRNLNRTAHLVIGAYDRYVKALEDMMPKPDWETP